MDENDWVRGQGDGRTSKRGEQPGWGQAGGACPYDTRDGGLLHGHEQALRCDGEVRHTHADGVEDGVRYRSAHRHDGGFTNALGSEGAEDRKSTRLNSSHTVISYAVFCLKKKKH